MVQVDVKKVWIWVIVAVLSLSLIGMIYYLFVYDRNSLYQPQLGYTFLQEEIERLSPVVEDVGGEAMIDRDGFKGILEYGCAERSAEEIKDYFAFLTQFSYDENPYTITAGEHITFPNDSYEIFVEAACYTKLVDALGYGWWDYTGNLYEEWHGKEEAKDKPNYRNRFEFFIRKGDEQFGFTMFCNTKDAERALSEAVNYMNEQVNKA